MLKRLDATEHTLSDRWAQLPGLGMAAFTDMPWLVEYAAKSQSMPVKAPMPSYSSPHTAGAVCHDQCDTRYMPMYAASHMRLHAVISPPLTSRNESGVAKRGHIGNEASHRGNIDDASAASGAARLLVSLRAECMATIGPVVFVRHPTSRKLPGSHKQEDARGSTGRQVHTQESGGAQLRRWHGISVQRRNMQQIRII